MTAQLPNDEYRKTLPQRAIALAFELIDAIVEDPTRLERIPAGATLVLLPDDDEDLARYNADLGRTAAERGELVHELPIEHEHTAGTPGIRR